MLSEKPLISCFKRNEKYIILLQVYTQRSHTGLGSGQNYPLASSRGGLYRSPSMEFKEVTKKDAEVGLSQELDKLRRAGVGTGCLIGEQADIVDRDFDGFKRLFAKYLSGEAKTGIDWSKIDPLADGAVSYYINQL